MSISVPAIGAAGAIAAAAGALGNTMGKAPTAADKAKAAADASAAQQSADLAEIRKKGLYAWAQEKKWEKLKAQIRDQVLHERGLTEDGVAGMNPTDRLSLNKTIEEEVAARVKDVMQKDLESQAKGDARQNKPPAPMIIDIKV